MDDQQSKKEIFLPGIGNLFLMPNEEKAMMRSYNQEFYSTLSTLKQTRFPTIRPEKSSQNYFYEYHNNENASITSSAGQIFLTVEDAFKLNLEIKSECIEIRDSLKEIRRDVDDLETLKDLSEYTKSIRLKVQNFLVDQKTETFKLVKEIAILTKDKIDLQNKITMALDRIKRLEEEVGIKPTLHSNSVDNLIKGHVTYENRFFEKELSS